MKIFALIVITLMMLPSVLAQTSPAGAHSCVIGTPAVNEFVINWTDSKNYTNLEKDVRDGTVSYADSSETWLETTFDLTAYTVNDTNDNSTLSYEISWHPTKKNRSNIPYFTPEEPESRSDITIQGKKAILVKSMEKKIYEGSDKFPTTRPAWFFAKYFPDDYTVVIIRAPASEWKDSEFKAAISSLKVTPPAGYY